MAKPKICAVCGDNNPQYCRLAFEHYPTGVNVGVFDSNAKFGGYILDKSSLPVLLCQTCNRKVRSNIPSFNEIILNAIEETKKNIGAKQ